MATKRSEDGLKPANVTERKAIEEALLNNTPLPENTHIDFRRPEQFFIRTEKRKPVTDNSPAVPVTGTGTGGQTGEGNVT